MCVNGATQQHLLLTLHHQLRMLEDIQKHLGWWWWWWGLWKSQSGEGIEVAPSARFIAAAYIHTCAASPHCFLAAVPNPPSQPVPAFSH